MTRSYSELIRLGSLEERFRYLRLGGRVGEDTFGFDRWVNQRFYASQEWKRVRTLVITRDQGCDLGVLDYPIQGRILIHHMNPMTQRDIRQRADMILDPENLICASHNTHNAIHYGDSSLLPVVPIERRPGDTKLW